MKHDNSLKIIGETVILVPYRDSHVPKYHEWMGDDEILRLTGSERLTLEEEFAMQKSWAEDTDKCTFIVLDKAKFETSDENEEVAMIGDTNLFFNHQDSKEAEIEIMIAEKSSQRKGCATEALKLMMEFGAQKLNVENYIAKIKEDNSSSIKLFNNLGFLETSRSSVFKEVTLERIHGQLLL